VHPAFEDAGNPPFDIARSAEQRVPFVFNSPHSGRAYPPKFVQESILSDHALRQSEDVFVDQLFASVTDIGAPLLRANFPRAWLDVNREPYELDPLLFRERLPAHANTSSMRVSGGLGTVPRVVAENQPIYSSPPSLDEAMARIENVYRPYHETLRSLIAETVVKFGYCVLVDCHSMPSMGGQKDPKARPDIIIGDRYGTSCNGAISRELIRSFSDRGYSVLRNKPYAGGFITEHYGRPLKGLHSVQIEINRALYIDETTLRPHKGYVRLAADIRTVINALVSLPESGFVALSHAAE